VKLFIFLTFLFPALAQAECRQALALGLDVSGSVDSREYVLQRNGLAAALQNDEVQKSLLAMPAAPVMLVVYEWSGVDHQRILVNWQAVTTAQDLENFTTSLINTNRIKTDPSTAIGSSIIFGARLLSQQKNCWSHTLDLSGDGPSNFGPLPRSLPNHPSINQMTVNGLAVETENLTGKTFDLTKYYEAEVIRGQGAFVEKAAGFDAFEAAMVRKLLRELRGLNLSQLDEPTNYHQ